MKVTNKYEIPAIVIETGEIVKVDNQSPLEPKNGSMWHNTSAGRVFHDDELSFLVEISKAIEWLKGERVLSCLNEIRTLCDTLEVKEVDPNSDSMKQKILDLPLKSKWYDMIESGVKKEEYREIKPYWSKRFLGFDKPLLFSQRYGYTTCNLNEYTHVRFRYGYTKRTMLYELKDIRIGFGKPEWGAPVKKVFILSIGKRID